MKVLVLCAVAIGLVFPKTAVTQSESAWRTHNRAATAARASGDTAAYRMHVAALEQEVGATPRLATNLARLAFLMHDTSAARRWTQNAAAMGVPLDSDIVAQYGKVNGSRAVEQLQARQHEASRTIDHSAFAWQLNDTDMIAEDLAYDIERKRFLVTSVHRGGVYAIYQNGFMSTLVRPDPRLWGTFAVGIDSRRQALWVTTAAFPGTAYYTRGDSGKSALLEYDLVSGMLRQTYSSIDGGVHAFGDLTIATDGAVYLADGFGGGVYVALPGSKVLKAVVPSGTFASPQTPVVAADGRRLLVPDYVFGIASIDLASRQWHWLHHPDSLALNGIDGLYWSGGDLIAVQNGVEPNRISRLALLADSAVTRTEVMGRGGQFADLNHALILGDRLYFIERSGWSRMADDGKMTAGIASDAPQLRWIPIRSPH